MAAAQAEDVRVSFLFLGDLNGHHQEWLGSTTTNRHGVAAFDFATVSGCDQLVVGPTHARGLTLDLLMTDVPDLVRVAVVSPISNSDHSSLSVVISMAQAVPNLCVTNKVFLKHQVNWKTVCGAIRELPWRNIWLSDNPVEVLNDRLSCWLDVMYQPRSSVCVTRTNLGLMINCGTCHTAYILTFYIFLPSLNNNTIFIFSSYFIKHTLASFFKFLGISATKSLHLGI